MVIFSESKAGSNSGLTIQSCSCPGQGRVCGPCGSCGPLISLHGELPILEISFTSPHGTRAGVLLEPWTVHPKPPEACCSQCSLFQTWKCWPRRAHGGCSRPWSSTWLEYRRDRPPCWEHRSAVGHQPLTPRTSLSQACVTCHHTHPKARGRPDRRGKPCQGPLAGPHPFPSQQKGRGSSQAWLGEPRTSSS